MTLDVEMRLARYGETLEKRIEPIEPAELETIAAGSQLEPPRPVRRRGWLVAVAVGSAVVVLGFVLAVLPRIGDSSSPVVTEPKPAPTVTISTGLFAPRVLVPTKGAEWSVAGAHHGVVYVDSLDKVVMFGGHIEDYGPSTRPNDQTLVIDLETLIAERLDSAAPPPRSYHAMAYDRQSDRVILFGGILPDEYTETGSVDDHEYSDTWAFDPAAGTWEEMNPTQSPPPSSFDDMVYHPAADRVVLVGRNGVWTYDYEADTWEMRSTDGLAWHWYIPGSAAVDEASGLIVTVTTVGSDTRSFDLETNLWGKRETGGPGDGDTRNPDAGEPSLASAVYDPSSQRIIGYGDHWSPWAETLGLDTGAVFAYDRKSETWTHIGYGPELWQRLPMVYDRGHSRIVVFPADRSASRSEWQIWMAPSRSLGYESVAP